MILFLIRVILLAAGLLFVVHNFDGIEIVAENESLRWTYFFMVLIGLIIVDLIVIPLLNIITLPIRILTLGLSTIVINFFVIFSLSRLVEGFVINDWSQLVLFTLYVTVVRFVS